MRKYALFVSQLPQGESFWEWQIGPDLLATIGESYGIQNLSVQARVVALRESRYLRLRFRLEGWVVVPCDRGLEPIQLPIEANHEQIYSWDETYLPPADTEEFFTLGAREDRIDLTQAFYDYIGLAIPPKRVRPTCPDDQCPAQVHTYLKLSSEE